MNVGSGEEVTIRELAEAVKAITGSTAHIAWDASKPDGTPRKLCDTTLIRSLGWKSEIGLDARTGDDGRQLSRRSRGETVRLRR